ncbi:hypothetical protein LTR62_007847 [Meristemomyces frigidus]|uniref:Uncharacterized protein n=1 Tax=Meristemomyces frigidus TaxID=1508187 RepID=A0AAN7YNN5_9PEZI|nr:hypothetical protein LTR62_007847 [Meristemomyces frigidus]
MCSCGTVFPSLSPRPPQRRNAASKGHKAPSTRDKDKKQKPRVLTHEGIRLQKASKERSARYKTDIYGKVGEHGFWRGLNAATADEFHRAFGELVEQSGSRHVNKETFELFLAERGVSHEDAFVVALILLSSKDDKTMGKILLFALSKSGYTEATIRICSHALLGSKIALHLLRAAEIMNARGQLRAKAREGLNYRCMVLEGKISRALGDEADAIEMWEKAMAAAVKMGEALLRRKQVEGPPGIKLVPEVVDLERRDVMELSTPWVDLTLLRFDRYTRLWDGNRFAQAEAELEKAREAVEIGCRMDDPTSHYHAAEFFRKTNADGTTIHTSTWLYHITKAACSGYAIACHKLGVFYAESGWKYIEDEPPDHVKPTPFDSFPAPTSTSTSTLQTLKFMLGLSSSTGAQDAAAPAYKESDDMFRSAIFPSTPEQRWEMAKQWLSIAMQQTYAPSYLSSAQMLLAEKLWAQAQTPKSALEMTDARYDYASKADFEAQIPIAKADSTTTPPTTEQAPGDADIPIPCPPSNIETAKSRLAQVLYAHQAHLVRRKLLSRSQSAHRLRRQQSATATDTNEQDAVSNLEERHRVESLRGVPEAVKVFLRSPDTMEMYGGEIEGLARRVWEICDLRGWDLVGGDGGLLYKCRVGGGDKGLEG